MIYTVFLSNVATNPRMTSSLQNPEYMKNDFFIKIETMHLGDAGTTENVSMM